MRYEWKFGPAEVYSDSFFTDAVSHVSWWCVGYAPDGTTYKASGAVKLGTPDKAKFVPFNGINEATVRSWVFSSISQAQVEADLNSQYTNKSDSGVKPFNF